MDWFKKLDEVCRRDWDTSASELYIKDALNEECLLDFSSAEERDIYLLSVLIRPVVESMKEEYGLTLAAVIEPAIEEETFLHKIVFYFPEDKQEVHALIIPWESTLYESREEVNSALSELFFHVRRWLEGLGIQEAGK